ncbi:unnamed protein product [Cyprideis torosa]|uniref:Uncharacterized protein n=1 Tax=Cyprideis torosa TaxID=163714 RepID=A0A7R8WCR5_9CRUS|nr:unnamed protein product [Cyprideis torosa]CAG0893794.1 unnamed protein product [Cyprideis torosa]
MSSEEENKIGPTILNSEQSEIKGHDELEDEEPAVASSQEAIPGDENGPDVGPRSDPTAEAGMDTEPEELPYSGQHRETSDVDVSLERQEDFGFQDPPSHVETQVAADSVEEEVVEIDDNLTSSSSAEDDSCAVQFLQKGVLYDSSNRLGKVLLREASGVEGAKGKSFLAKVLNRGNTSVEPRPLKKSKVSKPSVAMKPSSSVTDRGGQVEREKASSSGKNTSVVSGTSLTQPGTSDNVLKSQIPSSEMVERRKKANLRGSLVTVVLPKPLAATPSQTRRKYERIKEMKEPIHDKRFRKLSKTKPSEETCGMYMKNLIYNPEEGSFVGRTPGSWLCILMFFIAFFAVVSGYFFMWWFIWYAISPHDQPLFPADGTFLSGSLSRLPKPSSENEDHSMIWLNSKHSKANEFYAEQLRKEMKEYDDQSTRSGSRSSCNKITKSNPTACIFDRTTLKEIPEDSPIYPPDMGKSLETLPATPDEPKVDCLTDTDFGYTKNQPCFMLKPAKIVGLDPTPLEKFPTTESEDELDPKSTTLNETMDVCKKAKVQYT